MLVKEYKNSQDLNVITATQTMKDVFHLRVSLVSPKNIIQYITLPCILSSHKVWSQSNSLATVSHVSHCLLQHFNIHEVCLLVIPYHSNHT